MTKVLFISANVLSTSAQGVRYQHLLPLLSERIELKQIVVNNKKGTGSTNTRRESSLRGYKVFSLLLILYKRLIRPFIFPDKFIFLLSKQKNIIKRYIEKDGYSVVIIAMTPFSLYEFAPFVKSVNAGVKVIVELSDPFVNNASNRNSFIKGYKRVKRYERKKLLYVDHLVVLTENIKELYINEYDFRGEISVVEQGIESVSRGKSLKERIEIDMVKLIYAGALYPGFREPFSLFDAVLYLYDNIHLTLYGNFDTLVNNFNEGPIEIKDPISQEALFEEYEKSDIIVFIDNSVGNQVPGKIFELLAIAKPVLFIYSNENSPTLNYAKQSRFFIIVKDNPENIQSGINEIINRDFKGVEVPDLSRYEWKSLAEKYLLIINKLNDTRV